MADKDNQILEREYTIPLRRHWFKVANYERTRRSVKAIKIFIAKHMKVEDRDVNLVKLDVYFNNELWFKGRASPPARIKVKAKKEKGIVTVNFVEDPSHVKFAKIRHGKLHKKGQEKVTPSSPDAHAQAQPENKEEAKVEEKEKEKATAIAKEVEIKQDIKADKHTNKVKKAEHPHRMALQK